MILVSMSPLAKIFQPFFYVYEQKNGKLVEKEKITQEELMENPDRIWVDEPFSITVSRSSGDLQFISGQHKFIGDQLLRFWLSGGAPGDQMQETDQYGIVQMPIDPDVQGAMTYYMSNPNAKMDKSLTDSVKDAQELAKKLSTDRVMRSVTQVYTAMMKQYQLNDENKQGRYQPSPTEFLCAYAMKSERENDINKRKKIADQFSALLSQEMV